MWLGIVILTIALVVVIGNFVSHHSFYAIVQTETKLLAGEGKSIEEATEGGLRMMGELRPNLALAENELKSVALEVARIVRHPKSPWGEKKNWTIFIGRLAKACETAGTSTTLLKDLKCEYADERVEQYGPVKKTDKETDVLFDRAEALVPFAQALAAMTYTALMKRFPILREVDLEQWDFIVTVAGVFMASTRLINLSLGDDREGRLMEVVTARLNQWKPDGIRGFEDCKMLFEKEFDRLTEAGDEPHSVASDAVGKWIVWNVLGRPPQTDEECMLVMACGTLVTEAIRDCWDE